MILGGGQSGIASEARRGDGAPGQTVGQPDHFAVIGGGTFALPPTFV
jgi:hypothetical protein